MCVSDINKNVQEITCAGKGNYNDFSVPPPREASCLVVQTVNCDSEFSYIQLGTGNLVLQFGVNFENYSEYFACVWKDSEYFDFFYRIFISLPIECEFDFRLFWNNNKGYYIFVLKGHLYTVCEGIFRVGYFTFSDIFICVLYFW